MLFPSAMQYCLTAIQLCFVMQYLHLFDALRYYNHSLHYPVNIFIGVTQWEAPIDTQNIPGVEGSAYRGSVTDEYQSNVAGDTNYDMNDRGSFLGNDPQEPSALNEKDPWDDVDVGMDDMFDYIA